MLYVSNAQMSETTIQSELLYTPTETQRKSHYGIRTSHRVERLLVMSNVNTTVELLWSVT